jgi:arylsulfatase A
MNRRVFLKLSATAGASVAIPTAAAARTGKPNVVVIMADDLGYECLRCNGGTSYKTPNLDALAASGIRFTHAYAQPLCAPTRLQLMTGQYNVRNYEAFGVMNPKEKTFGHMMKQAGYKTCIAGKWQMYSYNPPDYQPEWRGKGMLPKDSGFDEYCLWHAGHTEDKGSRYADPVVLQNGHLRKLKGEYGEDVFVSFLSEFMDREKERPFFVYYPMALTHAPFVATPRSAEWKSGDRLKSDTKFFGDMVEYMDECVGRVVSAVDRLGLRDETLIIFYSDNGTPKEITSRMGDRIIPGGKGDTTDSGTHVPMIASWRGTTPAGKVLDDLVDSTDFLPTLAELGGMKVPAGLIADGQSFVPQLRGKKGTPREWIYSYYDPRPGWDKDQFSLKIFARDKRYKLYSTGELFDIPADPFEKQPLPAGRESREAAAARVRLARVIQKMAGVSRVQPRVTKAGLH